MVVNGVDPAEVLADGGPVGRGVDLAVFLAIVGDVLGPVAGDVSVDEIAEEEHELGVESGEDLGEVLETGDGEGVAKGVVGQLGDDAGGREEGEGALLRLLGVANRWRGGKLARVVVRGAPLVSSLLGVPERNVHDGRVVGLVGCPSQATGVLP